MMAKIKRSSKAPSGAVGGAGGSAAAGEGGAGGGGKSPPLPTQQFGVSLQFIKENNGGQVIPPVVRQCVEYLTTPDGENSIFAF
jgi:hypothetical protein